MKKKSFFSEMLHKYRRVFVLCSILCFFLGVCFCVFLRVGSDSLLKKVSQEDQLVIEPFLKDLVFNNHFGYVLLDEKPVSIASYFSREPFMNLLLSRKRHAFDFEHSWGVIEKYKVKLNSGNFVFFKQRSNFHILKDRDSNVTSVYEVAIINKKLFLRAVENNLNLFRKILGNWVTPDALLVRIAEAKVSLFEALDYDEELFGILLGYGKKNAHAFKRNMELACVVDPYFQDIALPFSLHLTKPSPGFNSLEEEYAYLQTQLIFFNLQIPLSPFMPPAFRALKDDEDTQFLEKKYRGAHRRLVKMYSGKDFLKITLMQFLKD